MREGWEHLRVTLPAMSGGIRLAGAPPGNARSRGRSADRSWDAVLHGLCMLASLLALLAIGAIAYKVIDGASPSISRFGLGFLVHTTWQPNFEIFGAATFVFGTAVTSFVALL